MFKKSRKWVLLACFIIGIIIDAVYCRQYMEAFPEIVITREDLLHDEEHAYVKEFEVLSDESMISRSGDAWISWSLEEPVQIEEMNIVLESLDRKETWGEIYLLDSLDSMIYTLNEGENLIKFYDDWREKEVNGFRFDLTSEEDLQMRVDSIVINEHTLLFWEIQIQALIVFLAVVSLLVIWWAWNDFAEKKENSRYWIGGAVSLGLQIGMYANFVSEYIRRNKQGQMIYWYLILIAVLVVLEKVVLTYYTGRSAGEAHEVRLRVIREKKEKKAAKKAEKKAAKKAEENAETAEEIEVIEFSKDDAAEAEEVAELMELTKGPATEVSKAAKIKNTLALGLIFVLAAVMNFAVVEILGGIQFDFTNPVSLVFNVLACLGVILVFYLVSQKPWLTLLLSNLLLLILGLVNHYYYQFRGEPFEIASVIMADTALSVLDNYTLEISKSMWFVILAEILFLTLIFCVVFRNKMNLPKLAKILVPVPLAVVILVLCFHMPEVNYWSIAGTSASEGYLYSFLGYLSEMGKPDKPEGYSVEAANKLLEQYAVSDGGNTPDVIVIMNEAFADLPDIYDFETDTDTLPFIHSLTENTVKGTVLVSVFGGTTCNSEYEFLTSNSMAFMPGGSVPYMQYITEEQQSLAQLLKNQGYTTVGYHAFYKSGFHRSRVYPMLGFDEFYGWEDPLPGTDIFRLYMSDRANYHNVKYLYESKQADASRFIFNVTMQNHGGYAEGKPSIDVTSQPADEDMQTSQLQEYLSLLRESDDAFRELVEYYQNVEKDTIILMFGDHQPGLGSESYQKMDERVLAEDATLEERQKQYTSSFVMWANFDIEEQEDVFVSANYLRPLLLETAGMKLSSYDNFLLKLREKYPAINAFGYCDTDGNWYEIDDVQDSMIQQYAWLHYYNVFDKKKLDSNYYTE